MSQIWLWVGFNVFVLAMLAIDLGLFHRKAHAVTTREAGIWCGICVLTALLFNLAIWYFRDQTHALEFLAGYLIEMALSVDNIFVFVLIFAYFKVPLMYQHRVLFWGIIGALLMRGAMIGAGVALVNAFHWAMYIFGAFLIYTGVKMAVQKEEDIQPEANPVLRLVRRLMPVSSDYHGEKFFVREARSLGGNLVLVATPLFVVLVMIDVADLIFAVDSIPAVLGVTQKPLLVYTSNVFAILCLRALYFLIANLVAQFRFLQPALSVILSFVGLKMVVADLIHIGIGLSLGFIVSVLVIAVLASMRFPKPAEEAGSDIGATEETATGP